MDYWESYALFVILFSQAIILCFAKSKKLALMCLTFLVVYNLAPIVFDSSGFQGYKTGLLASAVPSVVFLGFNKFPLIFFSFFVYFLILRFLAEYRYVPPDWLYFGIAYTLECILVIACLGRYEWIRAIRTRCMGFINSINRGLAA